MINTQRRQTPNRPAPFFSAPFRACAILSLVLLCSDTLAQPGATSPPPPRSTTPKLNSTIMMSPLEKNPIRIDALNLNINLPLGSVAETTRFGTNATMGIGLPDQSGVMVIKQQKTSDPNLTVEQVADNIIKQLTRFASSSTGKILSRDRNLTINFWTGERFYIRIPGTNAQPDTVRGMTIFKSQPQKFIIFDLTTTFDNFEKARPFYETSIGTMDLGNPTKNDLRRAKAIKAMLNFLELRSVEDYQEAMTAKKDHWERLYMPGTSGDEMDSTEYGYRRVRSWGGFKGELTEKSKSDWDEDDHSLGYFVQIDAMALEEGMRVDTRATFYMAEDSKEESWTIKMSLRQDGQHRTSTITGARSGTSMAIMLDDSEDSVGTRSHPLIQGEGYISQVQTYLIGSMLANHAEPGEYASYAYNSSTGTISLRWDMVTKPEETPGLTRITTKVSNNTPPTESVYNEKGDLMRVRLVDGRLWEPIELSRLIKLWKKKGLPLE